MKHNITEEVSTAKQYTYSLFNNLKLELNPHIDYLTDRQAKLEHHLQHDQQMPSEPFASTPHTSKLPQPSNAMGMPSDIPTPTSCNMMDGHRPNPIRHGENFFLLLLRQMQLCSTNLITT